MCPIKRVEVAAVRGGERRCQAREREGLATVTPGDRLVLTHCGRLLTDAVVRYPLVP